MISGVTKTIAGEAQTFRLTTRAMMAIEARAYDEWLKCKPAQDEAPPGLIDVLQGLERGFRISALVHLISECANDGAGVDLDGARKIVDEVGVEAAADLIGRVAEAAFPEAKKATGKNAQGAARPK